MNSLLLCEADLSCLESIYHRQSRPPLASSHQRVALGGFLAMVTITADSVRLLRHVGLGDEVILVSPIDATDDFRFRIVLPHEADPALGLISALAPISLALLGREEGEIVSWDANGNLREMRITAIGKHPMVDTMLNPA